MTRVAAAVLALTMIAALQARATTQEDDALLRDGVFARDRNVSVDQRPHPEYAAVALHAGGFSVLPSITVSTQHDDNIYAAANSETSDTIIRIKPTISAASNWSRHALALVADLSAAAYANHSAENTIDYRLAAHGRLDAHHDLGFAGGLSYARETESRLDTASQTLVNGLIARPVRYDLARAYGAGAYVAGRYRLSGEVDAQAYSYDNARTSSGALVYQRDRDRTVWIERGRGEYALAPDASVFVSATLNQRTFRNAALGEALRNSSGYDLKLGASVDLSHLIQGEAAVGYLRQTYDVRLYSKAAGLSFDGALRWFPSGLTTVAVTARRSVADAGIPNVGGYIVSSLAAQIDHELLRNLVLSARAAWDRSDYRNYGRRDAQTVAHASARYLMNRAVTLSLAFDHTRQDSAGPNRGVRYGVNRIEGTLTYAL